MAFELIQLPVLVHIYRLWDKYIILHTLSNKEVSSIPVMLLMVWFLPITFKPRTIIIYIFSVNIDSQFSNFNVLGRDK